MINKIYDKNILIEPDYLVNSNKTLNTKFQNEIISL